VPEKKGKKIEMKTVRTFGQHYFRLFVTMLTFSQNELFIKADGDINAKMRGCGM
jgi:hypothetical protein